MPSVREGRVTKLNAKRPRSPIRRVSKIPLVEKTNALSIGEFIAQYVTPPTQTGELSGNTGIEQAQQSQDHVNRDLTTTTQVDIYSAATISATDLEACLNLIEQTSGEAYATSSGGWSRTKKRKEMKLPDMKYLILRNTPNQLGDSSSECAVTEKQGDDADTEVSSQAQPTSDGSSSSSGACVPNVLGFLSFMITYEDGKEVVYCYEIHLSPIARGQGVGKMLMEQMEGIGRAIGLEKAMLTVFKSNEIARQFYGRLGYDVDEYSPRPRKLRNGTIKEVEYLILSKGLED